MSADIKYAYKRHNTWVYRKTYPKALQPILGSSLKQSLRTADAKQAKARVAELNQTFTNLVKEAQARPMLMLQHMHPTLKLLSLLWRVLDISAQGFWVSSLFMG